MGQRQSEIIKNHMEVYWHDYASASKGVPITEAGLVEKASVIGRTGLMLLECGTGAWRVRSSMNTLSRELGVTTTADIGLLSIEFTCFDGDQCYTQSLCLTNTGVNTSRLNRLEHFVNDFDREGKFMTGEELHSHLDEIERIHGLYSPIALGFAAALACGCFTFLLGGGIVEMLCAFCGAGIGNFVRCKLTKHHFTLFLGITASVCSASLVYSIVEEVVRQIFAQFREVSRKKLLESVKTNDAARIQKKVKKIQKDLESKQKELDDLKAETILVIRGVSALDKELLGILVAEAREALETLEKQLVQAQEEYEEATKTAKRSNYICNGLFTWTDVYDTANHDERRAILQQFIKEIRVRKDYEISITLNASFNQVEQLKAVSTYDGAEIFEEISEKGA